MTPDEQDILRQHGEALASISTNIDLLRKDLNGKIPKLEKKVEDHSDQISFWRGAIAIVAFFLLLVGGVETWHVLVDHVPTVHAKP